MNPFESNGLTRESAVQMSKAYEIFNEAFSKPRDPRSDEYRHGVIDILKFRLGEANEAFGKRKYTLGTAQSDAYFAGTDEGHKLAREYLEKVGAGAEGGA